VNLAWRFSLFVASQNDIAWPHLLRGRFSRQWILLQQAHLDQDADCSPLLTGKRWLQKVLHHLQTHLCSAWKLCNADLHGIDKADQELKRKAKLRPAIVALCAAAAQLNYLDKRIFDLPLLTKPPGSTCTRRPSASPKPQQQTNFSRPNATIAHSLCMSLRSRETRGGAPCSRSPAEQGDEPQPVPRLRDGWIPPPCHTALASSHSSGRIVTLLAMPPAWVDFSWELVRGERDNVKNRSLLLILIIT
jgi:hypothetical protein